MGLLRSVFINVHGYAKINYDGKGKPNSLFVMHPDSIQVDYLFYWPTRYKHTHSKGKQANFLQEEQSAYSLSLKTMELMGKKAPSKFAGKVSV